MQPAARVASAADILDRVLAGEAVEKCLTTWGRKNRYAGSKDRAAIRDHVFQAIRCMRTFAALGGAEDAPTGRALMIGALRSEGIEPETVFTGVGHAPAPLSEEEIGAQGAPSSEAARHDMPDWLWPLFKASLGDAASAEAMALRERAPVFLRVNTRKATREQAVAALAAESITTELSDLASTALKVIEGARKVALSEAFDDGLVELQDAASQAVVAELPFDSAESVLDYCAGGGGKALAVAAASDAKVFAHDIAAERMRDIPVRAERAGSKITIIEPEDLSSDRKFDVVLCDAPCSGSGAWRRAPQGKWLLTPVSLEALNAAQLEVLNTAKDHVAEGGTLAYVTCSLLPCENADIVTTFLSENPDWQCEKQHSWQVCAGSDGFFLATLARN